MYTIFQEYFNIYPSKRGLYTSDSGIRLPKDQSTPINRINKSNENNGLSPVIAEVKLIPTNLPKPVNPLMPNKSNQNAHNIANRYVLSLYFCSKSCSGRIASLIISSRASCISRGTFLNSFSLSASSSISISCSIAIFFRVNISFSGRNRTL